MDRNITMEDLKSLKIAYEKAIKEGQEMFIYREMEVLTSYAKYLIEYMEHGPYKIEG